MNWNHTLFLSCFTAFLLLIVLDGRRNFTKATPRGSSEENLKRRLFVQRLDASKFLKKQEKISARSSEEFDDRTRTENLGYEYENTTEEDHDATEVPVPILVGLKRKEWGLTDKISPASFHTSFFHLGFEKDQGEQILSNQYHNEWDERSRERQVYEYPDYY